MLKRLVMPFAAICLLAVAATQPFEARAQSQTPLQEAIANLTPEQQARLKAYEAARLAFQRRTDLYWRTIELKRKKRKAKAGAGKTVTAADYVSQQPPEYNGPAPAGRRDGKAAQATAAAPGGPRAGANRAPVPGAGQGGLRLRARPRQRGRLHDPVRDGGDQARPSRDQVVRLYALETGGMGTQDLQSGYNPRTGHAASTALGYAQLLAANTIEQVRKEGEEFAARLERNAADYGVSGDKAEALRAKAAILRRMIADARKVHENWPAHVAYAKTPNGIGMHALNLDGDVGPWLQTVKLRGIVEYASKKGMTGLSGAQLELMNLAGPSHGFEMMQPIGSTMPTSNFFERRGYERNPVAAKRTGAQLLAKLDEIMDRNVQKQGAQRFARIFDSLAQRLSRQRTQSSEVWQPFSFMGR